MTQLAYLLAALSLSLLTACSSKDASLSQQPEVPSTPAVTMLTSEVQPTLVEPSTPSFQTLQAELASFQQRLQTTEASLAQAQTALSEKDEQLHSLMAEQQQWSAQQTSLDTSADQIEQLEQQLSQQAHALNQAQINLIQAESECQQVQLVKPDPKQVAGLDPSQVEH